MSLKFDVSFDAKSFEKMFDDIGSTEFPRAVQYALDETAKAATLEMRKRMPKALGQKRGGQWQVNEFTLRGVHYDRARNYDEVKEIRSSIAVQPQQSTYLKYQFGQGQQERLPGDVGLADDVILIPDRQNLFYTTRIAGISPFGNEQMPKDLMKTIQKRIEASRGKPGAHAAAMAMMAKGARQRGSSFEVGPKLARVDQRLDKRSVPNDARTLGHYLSVAKKHTGLDPRAEWPLYRGKDVSGHDTIFARPGRLRDPAGGYHTFTRKDGTKARMPNMLGISKFDGRSGPKLGPRRLFVPTPRAEYTPILQAPWDESAQMAYAQFPDFMQAELDNRVVRRAQGRRY